MVIYFRKVVDRSSAEFDLRGETSEGHREKGQGASSEEDSDDESFVGL